MAVGIVRPILEQLQQFGPGARAKLLELLEDWPNDPYSHFVLAQAETALGDPEAAAEAERRSRVEWIGGAMDLKLA